MNAIRLALSSTASRPQDVGVGIWVDDESLIDRVRRLEASWWAEVGSPQPDGQYVWVPARVALLPGRRRQEKERQSMITNLKKNDEVLTIAGIYGTVVSVNETKDEIVVKVDDGTRLRMTKASIHRNISGEEAAKAAKAAKDQKDKK